MIVELVVGLETQVIEGVSRFVVRADNETTIFKGNSQVSDFMRVGPRAKVAVVDELSPAIIYVSHCMDPDFNGD